MEERLHRRVVGEEEAVEFANAFRRARTGELVIEKAGLAESAAA